MGIERRKALGFKQKPNCTKCGISFEKVERYTYKRAVRGQSFSNYCRKCKLKKMKISNKSRLQRGYDRKLAYIKERGGVCPLCGYDGLACPAVFDFHHIQCHNKEFKIANELCKKTLSKKVVKEIQGCILICSNCHRKLHHSGIYN